MRTCRKNKQKLKYALYLGKSEPSYIIDRNGEIMFDDDGNPMEDSGSVNKPVYDNPVEFYGNISFASGEAEAVAYGVSVGDYDSKLLMLKDEIPINETSLIFKESTPEYDGDGKLIRDSADFSVVKVQPSLNLVVYLLKRIVKNA
jgi:hypothetical protein